MNIFLFIALIVAIVLLIRARRKTFSPQTGVVQAITSREPLYRKRFSVMNKSEQAFFFELRKQLPAEYYIFPNMRLADILDAVDGEGFYSRNNKLMPRHIDFLICDSYFKPMVAIEVNGSSHNRPDRKEIDEQKREIFKEAGLPLEFVEVGTSFEQSVGRIKSHLTL